jgi:hypothetical protein
MTAIDSNNGKDKKRKGKSKKEIAKASYNSLTQIGTQTGLNDISISLRTGLLFDTQRQRQRKPRDFDNLIGVFNGFIVAVYRKENTILHQRVFEAALELGEIEFRQVQNVTAAILKIRNLYELKKLAGINTDTSDTEIINILEEISDIKMVILGENEEEKSKLPFHLLGNVVSKVNKKTNEAKSLEIVLDLGFIYAIKTLFTILKIDRETLQYIHRNAKSAYVEKLIKFFATQQKPTTFTGNGFWGLLKAVCDFPVVKCETVEYRIDKLSLERKRKIIAKIARETALLSEFGIEFDRKNLKITFNPANNIHKNIVKIRYSSI